MGAGGRCPVPVPHHLFGGVVHHPWGRGRPWRSGFPRHPDPVSGGRGEPSMPFPNHNYIIHEFGTGATIKL